jgi:cytochrome c
VATLRIFSLAIAATLLAAVSVDAAERLGIGSPISPEEIHGWNIDVRGDGAGLPSGAGTAALGREIFANRCAKCHGDEGQGDGRGPALKGGIGSLKTDHPIMTIGSYWPFAPTIFDYVRRAMPLDASQSLTSDEAYSLTAYLLYINGLIQDQNAGLSQSNLPLIRMPNSDGFISDDREKVEKRFWSKTPCMRNCAPITK